MTTGSASNGALPLVGVVVVNWGRWRETLECLRSLEASEYRNASVVVVDNASSDDSVERLRAARPGLDLLATARNAGFAGGTNVGIRWALARGVEYVWLLNSASLGRNSRAYYAHFNASTVTFFRRHASFPLLPIIVGVAYRGMGRLARGEWAQAWSIWRAVRAR